MMAGVLGSTAPVHSRQRGVSRNATAAATCILPVILLVSGCGRIAPPVAEPERAAAIVADALAAWRDGETSAAMRRRSPPVFVADECWVRGDALESFTVGPPRPFGPATRFLVTLVGPPPLGRRTVVYTVSTQPSISISLVD